MSTVTAGSSINLISRFYDYQGGPLVDPDPGQPFTLDIQRGGESVLDNPINYPGQIVRETAGIFSYTYQVPSNADPGTYTANWYAFQDGYPANGVELFTVVTAGSGGVLAATNSLGEDFEINYVGVLEPAFIDPDDIMSVFPEAESAMALEAIHRASLEIQGWVPKATAENISPLMREYVFASVLCDLSQRYGFETADEYSITLGDLSVTQNTQTNKGINRGSAATWCERAAVLRQEVKFGLASMKGVVRGARLMNPIPRRDINKTGKNSLGHLQGTLDDVKRPPSRF